MKITALEPQANRADRVNVWVDGEPRMVLAAEVVFAQHLHVGDAVDDAALAALARRDEAWRAREAALLLLSFRARSAAELRRRLGEKGFGGDVADEVVAALVSAGVVDDAAFAEVFVRDRVRLRPHGRRRLARELRAKGVDGETAGEAIDEVLAREETDEAELARRAAAKWRPRAAEEPERARHRLYGFLARRGFGPDAIRAAMEDRLGQGASEGVDADDWSGGDF